MYVIPAFLQYGTAAPAAAPDIANHLLNAFFFFRSTGQQAHSLQFLLLNLIT
jgi:hypothetical protein